MGEPRSGSKVVTAAREKPLPHEPRKLNRERLKAGAADTALNLLSILRQLWGDFLSSDRFFKYKAAIVASWLAVSLGTIFVACPQGGAKNPLGARLIDHRSAIDGSLAISVRNQSEDTWRNVLLLVNGSYRAAQPAVEPGGILTVTPRQLSTPSGDPAPLQLQAVEVELRTSEGHATLLRGGKPP